MLSRFILLHIDSCIEYVIFSQEIFRSEVRASHPMSDIVGKCWVMTVKGKEYFNYAPEGYADEDVYVCEYRYSSRGRCFTKLKSWAFGSDRVKLVPRPKPLEPVRVASVFRDNVAKAELQLEDDALEKAEMEQFQVSTPNSIRLGVVVESISAVEGV